MHLDPWHLRLQMEKLKIKNNWCHFFAHSFFWETIMAQNQTHQTTLFLLDIIRLAPKFLRKIGWHNSPRLFGGERHMEVSNRCHYYPDIHHLTGTTLVGCSHSVGFQCAVSCHYIQGTIEVGRFARVIEDGIPLSGPKSEESAFPSCLDPVLPGVWLHRSMSQLTKPVIQRTNPNVQFTVHQCTSMYIIHQLIHGFFHCAHNSQFPRRCCSSPILGEIASAKLRPDTEFTATFRWCRTGMAPHVSIKYRCVFGAKNPVSWEFLF